MKIKLQDECVKILGIYEMFCIAELVRMLRVEHHVGFPVPCTNHQGA
jgi:hypothetical protein